MFQIPTTCLVQDIRPDLTLLSLRPTIATVRAEFMRRILLCREEAHWDNAWSTVCYAYNGSMKRYISKIIIIYFLPE